MQKLALANGNTMEIKTGSAFGLPSFTIRVVGPDGKVAIRAKSFKGEMAHMDSDRYAGDVVTAAKHGVPVW